MAAANSVLVWRHKEGFSLVRPVRAVFIFAVVWFAFEVVRHFVLGSGEEEQPERRQRSARS